MPHVHELIDFTVSVFITHDNKVLLIHHKKLNMWLPIGGHIELDEDPEETLFREVKEECGLEIQVLSSKPEITSPGTKFLYTPSFLDIHALPGNHKHIALTYFAKSKSDAFVHNREEHNDIHWFTGEDLEKPEFNLTNAVKFYCKEALKITN